MAYVQIRRHHVFRLGSLIGLRSVALLGEHDVWGTRGMIGELSEVTDSKGLCFERSDLLSESPEYFYIVYSELSWRIVL